VRHVAHAGFMVPAEARRITGSIIARAAIAAMYVAEHPVSANVDVLAGQSRLLCAAGSMIGLRGSRPRVEFTQAL
jgi:hypothetical protein